MKDAINEKRLTPIDKPDSIYIYIYVYKQIIFYDTKSHEKSGG